jgi:hypothetical protein
MTAKAVADVFCAVRALRARSAVVDDTEWGEIASALSGSELFCVLCCGWLNAASWWLMSVGVMGAVLERLGVMRIRGFAITGFDSNWTVLMLETMELIQWSGMM